MSHLQALARDWPSQNRTRTTWKTQKSYLLIFLAPCPILSLPLPFTALIPPSSSILAIFAVSYHTNRTRLIRKSHPTASFLNFFAPPVMPSALSSILHLSGAAGEHMQQHLGLTESEPPDTAALALFASHTHPLLPSPVCPSRPASSTPTIEERLEVDYQVGEDLKEKVRLLPVVFRKTPSNLHLLHASCAPRCPLIRFHTLLPLFCLPVPSYHRLSFPYP
ncbi:hypothetical protein GGX14DRAFT_597217 [Mycena pura]|uniref:Uncharacterized protein n=1 Tax=Mycena pura TaxID=153505 RepID=A0AAD6UP36_9AGAR|nr:hypothetical protein GGX14DRAFT_597217 [Mycena pura]